MDSKTNDAKKIGHTPGPWVWRNAHGGEPELVCPKHGMLLVMDAVRHGMNRADIRFARRDPSDRGGLMVKASDLLPKTGKCVPDYPPVENPDMRLIAAAPDLLSACRMIVEAHPLNGNGSCPECIASRAAAAAIAKAEGGAA